MKIGGAVGRSAATCHRGGHSGLITGGVLFGALKERRKINPPLMTWGLQSTRSGCRQYSTPDSALDIDGPRDPKTKTSSHFVGSTLDHLGVDACLPQMSPPKYVVPGSPISHSFAVFTPNF